MVCGIGSCCVVAGNVGNVGYGCDGIPTGRNTNGTGLIRDGTDTGRDGYG